MKEICEECGKEITGYCSYFRRFHSECDRKRRSVSSKQKKDMRATFKKLTFREKKALNYIERVFSKPENITEEQLRYVCEQHLASYDVIKKNFNIYKIANEVAIKKGLDKLRK